MADYAKELEASFRKIQEGDILTGTVIGVSETEITLDFGYYTDGIIRLEDASDDPGFSLKDKVEVGQTLSATVIRRDDGAGHILLSMKEAAALMAWDRLRELLESQENISVKISGVTRGGAVAYLEGIRGFIPASKLSLDYVEEDNLPDWLNKTIEVRVITADEEEKRLVMSARDILREAADAERAKKISNVEIGLVTEGTVETIKPYGAFINLGNGLSGLVHVSQISQQRIKHPAAVLKEGQKVKVKVIDVKDGKLSLSMKALEEVAAAEITEETFDLPETEAATTSLGALFAKLKL
ncbi:MAG: S1 RNA-binding domain-containing protein [Lachnospiraceae bacterium]|nr:S1 RNA-binding domain-containing protein [Lachnospiraceae bacterium]